MFTTTNYLNKSEEEIDFASLNYKKIHEQLRETLYRQRELKKEMNNKTTSQPIEVWLPLYLKLEREFNSLSGKMTKLCCLLAHSKGKLHMERARTFFCLPETIDVTLDMQRKIIGSFWKDYVIK
jgi:predicted transcriptional regulator